MTSPNVPSIELCREMQTLNICQDKPSAWFDRCTNQVTYIESKYASGYKEIIAPTVVEMMEALPGRVEVSKELMAEHEWCWMVYCNNKGVLSEDKLLPNALAKALIAIKNGSYENNE